MMDSRCSSAALGGNKVWSGLVRRISVIVQEIAAHPPNFTEFLALVACKCIKPSLVRVDEGLVHVFVIVG